MGWIDSCRVGVAYRETQVIRPRCASVRMTILRRPVSARRIELRQAGFAAQEAASVVAVSRYNASMSPASSPRKGKKSPPSGDTGQESLYLRFLSEKQVPITVKLRDGETVQGWIEYFDDKMIRLTREGKPNLFIYKHQIKTITENAKRRRAPRKPGTAVPGMTASTAHGAAK